MNPARSIVEESMVLGAGDSEADAEGFRALYTLEAARQVRSATLLLGSQAAAQDVVHDAFAALWRRWDSVAEHGPYLNRMVVNACRDQLRRARTAARVIDRSAVGCDVPAVDPDLFDALAKLRFEHRAAVVLRFYLQFSEAEIARYLGCRRGSVGPWIQRGLHQLAAALSDVEEHDAH